MDGRINVECIMLFFQNEYFFVRFLPTTNNVLSLLFYFLVFLVCVFLIFGILRSPLLHQRWISFSVMSCCLLLYLYFLPGLYIHKFCMARGRRLHSKIQYTTLGTVRCRPTPRSRAQYRTERLLQSTIMGLFCTPIQKRTLPPIAGCGRINKKKLIPVVCLFSSLSFPPLSL